MSRFEHELLVPEAPAGEEPWTWPDRRDPGGRPIVVARCGVGLPLAGLRTATLLGETNERY